jgi:hypothetical protein
MSMDKHKPNQLSLKEWCMAGGGVPNSHKGREHVWHRKVAKFAEGGAAFNTMPDMHDSGGIIQGPAFARGGIIHMANGGAAFGTFPQMKPRRAKQDAEAAKNVPVDLARGFASGVLGAPGDIESLVRMLPGLDERTILPTSEDVEKSLPFRSDTPVSRTAAGVGTLAGGFYSGPGAPIRLAGALPSAVKRAGQDFAQSISPVNVIKPKGGNFLTGSVEKDLGNLKRGIVNEEAARRLMGDDFTNERMANPINNALNNWVDRNLTNYVKKEMATPDDPVRKLAEEGITYKKDLLDQQNAYPDSTLMRERKEAGFPEQGMAQSPLAKAWERASDESLALFNAGDIQTAPEKMAQLEQAKKKMVTARDAL